ncbi:hypothetical protein DL98DRAFT_654969, partial [Cadophora sp. DSE1049]
DVKAPQSSIIKFPNSLCSQRTRRVGVWPGFGFGILVLSASSAQKARNPVQLGILRKLDWSFRSHSRSARSLES